MARRRSLSAVTTASVGLAISFSAPISQVAMQVHPTGAPTGGTVILEGTINGSQYFELGSWRAGADADDVPIVSDSIPIYAARCSCVEPPSGGTSPTFTADIAFA